MLDGYSVINMPVESEQQDLARLLPLAQDLVTNIKSTQQSVPSVPAIKGEH